MSASIDAVIFLFTSFVVIEYVPPAVTLVGAEPAADALMTRLGEPDTDSRLIAWTSKLTTCVATSLSCACAVLAPRPMVAATSAAMQILFTVLLRYDVVDW